MASGQDGVHENTRTGSRHRLTRSFHHSSQCHCQDVTTQLCQSDRGSILCQTVQSKPPSRAGHCCLRRPPNYRRPQDPQWPRPPRTSAVYVSLRCILIHCLAYVQRPECFGQSKLWSQEFMSLIRLSNIPLGY